MSSRALSAVLCAVALGLAGCVSLQVDEGSFFWPNERVAAETVRLPSDPPPPGAETLALDYAAGRVGATLVRAEGAARPLILFCGGNLFRRSAAGGATAAKLLPFGDVLMWDYPGYGDTAGGASLAAFRAAGETVAAEARRRADVEGRRLILWGHSLGGVVCSQAAVATRADALVLETTTPGARATVQQEVGLLRPFVRVGLSPDMERSNAPEALQGFTGKVVVLEAGRDRTLSPKLSRRLERDLKARGVSVERLVFPEADHNNVGAQRGFRARVAEALAR